MSDFRNDTPITPEQEAVFEKVKVNIVREYQDFDMDNVVNFCGSPSCIGGHIGFVIGQDNPDGVYGMWKIAIDFLNLRNPLDGSPLFWAGAQGWDNDLRVRYLKAEYESDKQAMAQVGCEAIDRFIANTHAYFKENKS